MRNVKQFTECLKIIEKYNPTGDVIGVNLLGKDTSKQMTAAERKLLQERGFLTQDDYWYFYDIPEEEGSSLGKVFRTIKKLFSK